MLEAVFSEIVNTVTVSGLTQWDYGRKLYIRGVDLDEVSEVHFCNAKEKEAIVMAAVKQGDHVVCDVPNILLERNVDITAWIYDVGNESGKTVKTIILKVKPRTKPQDFVSENPDASGLLEDTLNKINQNIQDNTQFKNDMEKDQADFKVEVNKLVAGKLIDDEVISDVRTWSSEKITNYPFTNIQGEDTVNFDSGIEQIIQPKLYGKSSQVRTKGYQLFDASKLPTKSQGSATVTNNGDGSFTISGSGNLTSEFTAKYTIDDTATINKLFKNGKIYSTKVTSVPRFYVYGVGATENVLFSTSRTFEADITDVSQIKRVLFVFYSSSGTITPMNIKPMVYQDGDGTWEPFTGGKPSPSPEYPQEIVNKEISEISVTGKNLLNSNLETTTLNGVTCTRNNDGTYTLNGTSTNRCIFKLAKPFSLKANTYKVVCSKVDYKVAIIFSKRNYADGDVFHTTYDRTMTLSEDITAYAYINIGNGVTLNNVLFKPMLTLDLNATYDDFEPYKQPQIITLSKPITLRGIPVSKDGNVTIDGKQYISDVITEKDGVIGVESYFKKMSFSDMSESNVEWGQHGIGVGYLQLRRVLVLRDVPIKSNAYIGNKWSNISGYTYTLAWSIVINDNRFTNRDVALELMRSENPYFIFKTSDTTFEPLPQVDQDKFRTLLAHQGTTNLFANAYIDLNYISSSKYVLPYPIYSENEVDERLKVKADGTHTHTKSQITDMPTKVSQFSNDSNYQTLNQVKAQISALVNSAPSTLDTLNELAKALGNDPNFATTMTNLIATKAPLHHDHDDRYPTSSDIGNMRFKAISKSEYDSLGSKDPITIYFIYD